MKLNKLCIFASLAIVGLMPTMSSCYKDHSTVIEQMIPDIVIAEFPEELYTVESYSGNRLTVTPDIRTDYPESELTYEWYLIDRVAENKADAEHRYEREHIASGKTLDYEVNRAPGDYIIILEVQARNGYLVSRTLNMRAVTSFSQGFYILKQTPDGQTEIDLFNPVTGAFKENIFTALDGHPIASAPGYLSVCHDQAYIDVVSHETQASAVVSVTTADGQIRVMRTSDLRQVFSRDNLLYESFDADEVPYRIITCFWLNVLITNKGLRSQYEGTLMPNSTGLYGLTNGVAGSPYVSYNEIDQGLFFWDATTNSIAHCDYNGTIELAYDDVYKINRLRNTECMHTGYNFTSQLTTFITRNRMNDARQLYTISASFGAGYHVDSSVSLAGSHIDKAVQYTTCYRSAACIYGLLADGTIWSYSLDGGDERQIIPAGIPSDETITYISDKSIDGDRLYFVVGTTKGDRYTLRFYSMLGGVTDGAPVYTITSTGSVKSLHYTGGDMSSYRIAPLHD